VSRKEELQALGMSLWRSGAGSTSSLPRRHQSLLRPLTGVPDDAFDKIFTNNVKSVLWLAA